MDEGFGPWENLCGDLLRCRGDVTCWGVDLQSWARILWVMYERWLSVYQWLQYETSLYGRNDICTELQLLYNDRIYFPSVLPGCAMPTAVSSQRLMFLGF